MGMLQLFVVLMKDSLLRVVTFELSEDFIHGHLCFQMGSG